MNTKIKYTILTLFIVIPILLMFAPILFSNKIFFDEDIVSYNYPTFFLSSTVSKVDQNIDWNPYYLSGFPTTLSPVGDHIDPLNEKLISIFDDPFDALHFRIFLSVALGLIFSILFGLAVGLSIYASIFLFLAYLTAYTLNEMTAALVNSGAFFVTPALFYVVYKIQKDRHFLLYGLLGAIVLGYGWLSGFIQFVFYSSVLAFIYSIYLGYKHKQSNLFRRFRSTFGIVLVGFISILLALPRLIDTILFKKYTLRVSGFGSESLQSLVPADILNFFFPDYIQTPFISSEWVSGLYIGAPAILFVFIAIFFFHRKSEVRFFGGTYLGVLLILIPIFGLGWLMQQLPIFSSFHSIKRLLVPASFLLSFLGAYGFDLFCEKGRELGKNWKKFFVLSTFVTSLVIIGTFFLNIFFALTPWRELEWREIALNKIFSFTGKSWEGLAFSKDHYLSIFHNALVQFSDMFSLLNWKFVFPIVLLLISLFILNRYSRGLLSKASFVFSILILMSLNSTLVFVAQFDKYLPKDIFENTPSIAKVIREQEKSPFGYYVMSFLTGDSVFRNIIGKNIAENKNLVISRELLTPNFNFFYGIPRVDGYEPFLSARQSYIWNKLIAPEILPSGIFEKVLAEKKKEFLSFLPLLSSYNVKYIISGYPIEDNNLIPINFDKTEIPDLPIYLYQNLSVLSRVYIPNRVKIVSEWSPEYFDVIADNNTPNVIIECYECKEEILNLSGGVKVQEYKNTSISLKVSAESNVWVVIANSNLPGWEATIDGLDTSIYTANYLMQTIFVPKGNHDLILTFTGSQRD